VGALCALAKDQHLLLASYDRLSGSLQTRFDDIVAALGAHKEISWSDRADEENYSAVDSLTGGQLADHTFSAVSPGCISTAL